MLSKLDISNYALIDNVNLNFKTGFSVITGETGAGKSILLKALNLLLGERADYSVLKQNDKKCILEAEFKIKDIIPQSFFIDHELDYDTLTIVRREFATNGKSRIFINDTPTTLATLKLLGQQLVKIHTQHQTLELFNTSFQFEVIDAYSGLENKISSYLKLFQTHKKQIRKLADLTLQDSENRKEKDYLTFLVNELEEANLDGINIHTLENEYNKIQNWSAIKAALDSAISIFQEGDQSPVQSVNKLLTILLPLQKIEPIYNEFILRLNSLKIDLQDIESELESKNDLDDLDEDKAVEVKDKIENINSLSYKHNVNSIEELISLKNTLSEQIKGFGSVESEINSLQNTIKKNEQALKEQAQYIHTQREKNCQPLENDINSILEELGMPNAELKLDLSKSSNLNANGINTIDFLFKTNLGGDFLAIKKTASGGELSRLMLSILVIMAKTKQLPTLLFDEIDTGVSGEIAAKMATVFEKIGLNSQLISITHLPQIAARGNSHYHVFKADSDTKTSTKVEELKGELRVQELAKMISGEIVTASAIENAKQLLNHH